MNEDRTERMTEAQIERMKALDGFPTEEIVLGIARFRRVSIDEALTMIDASQKAGDEARPSM